MPRDGVPGLRDWLAAFLATSAATIISSVTIATVITLSGGAPQFRKLPEMIQFGLMVALANTSLALLAVAALWVSPTMLWLLILPLVMVFLAYQAYVSEREKHERLELLYQSSRILQHSPEIDSTLVALLSHARTMFRAELAEVVLYPRADRRGRAADPLVARARTGGHGPRPRRTPRTPSTSASAARARPSSRRPTIPTGGSRDTWSAPCAASPRLIGSLIISNRLTEGTMFSDDDLRLLETLANQAAVALENGHLEQSLAELSRLKEQLRYQAYHDPLTGLPNRTLFLEKVGGPHRPIRATRCRSCCSSTSTTSRSSTTPSATPRATGCSPTSPRGCAPCFDPTTSPLDWAATSSPCCSTTTRACPSRRPSPSGSSNRCARRSPSTGHETTVGASIGIAAARLGTEEADELLRNADVAMYTAKASGKNRVSVFEPTMHAAIVDRHALSAELARSLGQGELAVYYQPIVVAAGRPASPAWRRWSAGAIRPRPDRARASSSSWPRRRA